MKKIIKRVFVIFVAIFTIVNFPLYEINASKFYFFNEKEINKQTELDIKSKSAILIEANTGKVIYEKNPDEKLRPASVTKIMTLLLAFEKIDSGEMKLNDIVTISENAASMGGSQCFFETGEQQSVNDIIKCIEVASGNDAAVALAEHIAGSEQEFVRMMNEKAKELKMDNTHFENPCGLEADGHLTTARDIAIMSRELIKKHDDIFNYSSIWMDSIIHKTRRGESQFDLANTNKFLKLYQGANGLKTGYTSQAKYCMSATATRNDITLIAVIMGADTKEIRNEEAIKLLDYGFLKCIIYKDESVIPDNVVFKIKGGKKDNVICKPINKNIIVLIDSAPDKIEKKIIPYENLKAPINENDIIGVVQYSYEGKLISEIRIYSAENIQKKSINTCFKDLSNKYFMIK